MGLIMDDAEIEQLARILCRADGFDPDAPSCFGEPVIVPRRGYLVQDVIPAWILYRRTARHALEIKQSEERPMDMLEQVARAINDALYLRQMPSTAEGALELARIAARAAIKAIDNTGSNMAAPSQDGIPANSSVQPPKI